MAQLRARTRKERYEALTTSSAVYAQPGEPPAPGEPAPVGGLARDDPAYSFVVRSLAMAALAGFDVEDPEVISRAIAAGRRLSSVPVADVLVLRLNPPVARERDSWVYYMLLGTRCKIGYTTDLPRRVQSFNPDVLLAVEPGSRALEARRHAEFAALHVRGEWFRYQGALVDHIARVVATADARTNAAAGQVRANRRGSRLRPA